MFGHKKEIKREIVECEDCSCLLYRDRAQCVQIQSYEIFSDKYNRNAYLCSKHRVAYDRVVFSYSTIEYFKDSPTKVNSDGTPCGYVKEVKKEDKKSEPPHNYVDIKIPKAEATPKEDITAKRGSRKKMCTKCKTDKLLTKFSKSKSGKNGRQSVCKKCVKKYNDAYYLKKKIALVPDTLN